MLNNEPAQSRRDFADVSRQIGTVQFVACFGIKERSHQRSIYPSKVKAEIIETPQANQDARESERLHRTIFEQAAVGVAQLDSISGRILKVNQRSCDILGTPAETLQSKTWMDLTHPDDLAADQANMKRLLAGQIREFAMEKRLQRGDGSFIWINLSVSAMWERGEEPSTHIAVLQDISVLKENEFQLRVSHDLHEQAQEIARLGSYVWNIRDNSLVWSDELCRIYGEDPGSFKPSWNEFLRRIHPDGREQVEATIRQAVEQCKAWEMEECIIRSDGAVRFLATRGKVNTDEHGNAATVVGVCHDITETKLAEEALRSSEERFRQLIEHAPDAIVLLDIESNRFALVNPAAERLFELSAAELCRRGPVELSPPLQPDGRPSSEKTTELIQQTCTGERPVLEWMFRDAGGRDYLCEVRLLRLEIEGRVVIRGSIMDITERKEADARLRESESRYRAVVQDQTEFIVRWKPDGVRTFVNDAYCRCFGQSREQLLGTSFFPLISESDRRDVLARVGALTPEHPVSSADHRVYLPDGKVGWQSWTDRALFDERGQLVGYQSVGRDVSERKEAEEALRASQQRLRQLNVELERRVEQRTAELADKNAELEAFARSASHDLRAPLRAMEGFAQALAEDYGDRLDDAGRDYIQQIVDSSQRMETLIQDLLSYSRLGQKGLRQSAIPLDAVVQESLTLLRSDIVAGGARVTVGERLPTIRAHRETVLQIVTNLIANALKFVAPGVTPEVNVWSELRDDGMIRLWVEDNGIGIKSEAHERVFQVFERLHGIERYSGTGIGLAIVARGCERLGGQYGVESVPGQGSRFWIELPGF